MNRSVQSLFQSPTVLPLSEELDTLSVPPAIQTGGLLESIQTTTISSELEVTSFESLLPEVTSDSATTAGETTDPRENTRTTIAIELMDTTIFDDSAVTQTTAATELLESSAFEDAQPTLISEEAGTTFALDVASAVVTSTPQTEKAFSAEISTQKENSEVFSFQTTAASVASQFTVELSPSMEAIENQTSTAKAADSTALIDDTATVNGGESQAGSVHPTEQAFSTFQPSRALGDSQLTTAVGFASGSVEVNLSDSAVPHSPVQEGNQTSISTASLVHETSFSLQGGEISTEQSQDTAATTTTFLSFLQSRHPDYKSDSSIPFSSSSLFTVSVATAQDETSFYAPNESQHDMVPPSSQAVSPSSTEFQRSETHFVRTPELTSPLTETSLSTSPFQNFTSLTSVEPAETSLEVSSSVAGNASAS